MKRSPILFVLVGFTLGFAVAWMAKPAPKNNTQNISSVNTSINYSGVNSGNTNPDKQSPEPRVSDRDPETEEERAKDLQTDELLRQFHLEQEKLLQQQVQSRVNELAKNLKLNDAQTQKLEEFLGRKIALINGNSELTEEEATEALRQENMDSLMESMLSAEQLKDYKTQKAGERDQMIEGVALASFSELTQTIKLRDDQRDAVYDIMYENTSGLIDNHMESGQSELYQLLGSAYGRENLPDIDTIETGNSEGPAIIRDENGNIDKAALVANVRESSAKKIDAKVKRFEGVLDESQLQQYRESLEAEAAMMLQFMEGFAK